MSKAMGGDEIAKAVRRKEQELAVIRASRDPGAHLVLQGSPPGMARHTGDPLPPLLPDGEYGPCQQATQYTVEEIRSRVLHQGGTEVEHFLLRHIEKLEEANRAVPPMGDEGKDGDDE